MEEVSPIVPIWKYLTDEENKKIAEIHLLLWQSGAAVAGFDADGIPIAIQSYLPKVNPNEDWINQLIQQDILLKESPKKVQKIWVSEHRNLLVPNEIYQQSQAEGWLRKFHHLGASESLVNFQLNDAVKAHIVFPISEILKIRLQDSFPKSNLEPLANVAFQPMAKEGHHLQVVVLPQEILMTLTHNERFIYHHTFPYENSENVVYKVALVLDENNIPQEELKGINLSGLGPFWNNIIETLSAYFPVETISKDTTEISINFLKNLYQCAS